MIIISHRANLDGPGSGENHPEAIQAALDLGYDVEVDIWYNGHYLLTGHDHPQHPLPTGLTLHDPRMWWHCKNPQALDLLLSQHHPNAHPNALWHQTDDLTITTHGYLWCHTNKPHPGPYSVLLLFDRHALHKYLNNPSPCHAICTDYPKLLKRLL